METKTARNSLVQTLMKCLLASIEATWAIGASMTATLVVAGPTA
jgi:hypothetical protein